MSRQNKIRELGQTIVQKAQEIWQKAGVRRLLVAAIIFFTLSGILVANLVPLQYDLKVGQVSPRDVEAPRTVENRFETERLRQEAVEVA
ncbi:MAG: hypothetical protein GX322_00980, partial [Firmicutes bacterium]|nr:hypothetical protein [Bacillota bacterium]